jgi:two-component system response regulator HydG
VVTLRIPPLRERKGDIPLLAEHFLRLFCKEHGREPKRLTPRAVEALQAFAWPGNVRELKNAMESIVVFHRGAEVTAADLPVEIRRAVGVEDEAERPSDAGDPQAAPPTSGELTMADIERQAILAALERTGGRRAEAAKLLDIGLRTLQRKLKEYKQQGLFGG